MSIAYYAYWSGFATKQVEIYFQPGRMVGLFPTHDEQTLIFVQWPAAERATFKADIGGNYLATLHLMSAVAERLDGAERGTRIVGMVELPSSSARRSGRAGRWSATPATTRIRWWLAGSVTRGATASSSQTP